MALLRIDGWDSLPANSSSLTNYLAADGWTGNVAQMSTVPGRYGGNAIGFNSGFSFSAINPIGKRYTTETCVIGFALTINTNNNMGGQIGAYDAQGGGGYQWLISFEQDGVIRLYRNTQGGGGINETVIATTPAKTLHPFQFNFIEIKHVVHPTAGMVEVRVNTVVVLSYVGNTANTNSPPILSQPYGWDTIGYVGAGGVPMYWDDRYILDNTGANNTDYLGNCKVNLQLPTANGDTDNFAVSGAASNWQAVLGDHIDDTKYVYDSVVGDIDLYTPNPNVVATNIFGAQVVHVARQDDATQKISTGLLKVSGTVYPGSNHYLSGNYTWYRDMWELNPVTAVGWTAAQLNGVQAGIKVIQ